MITFRDIISRPIWRLSILAGLLVFAYPPFPFGFFAWVILALVLGTLDGHSITSCFRYGWWFGFCMHLGLLYWTAWVTLPGMLAVAIILGIYVGIVFAAYAFLQQFWGKRTVWIWPVLWVAHEYLRGLGVLGFPWTNLSYSQTDYTNLIQAASVTGDLGLGLWVAYLNVILFCLGRNWGRQRTRLSLLLVFGAMLVLPLVYGKGEITRLDGQPGELIHTAVLQGNIDSHHKWDSAYTSFSYATYYALSHLAAARAPDLIVWPETAAPGYLRADIPRLREVQKLSLDLGLPLLIGTLEYRKLAPGQYMYYNAAHFVERGRLGPKFHAKLQLVPMGEWIPFSDRVKILKDIHVGQADFTAGKEFVTFAHSRGSFGALICFESAFPDLVRGFVNHGARFLVNITNDGWYGFTPGPYQHAGMCVWRAIENRVPIARSANSGLSMFVDRAGRVLDQSDLFFADLRTATLTIGSEKSFFTRHGMWLGQGCLLLSIALLAGGLFLAVIQTNKRRRGKNATW